MWAQFWVIISELQLKLGIRDLKFTSRQTLSRDPDSPKFAQELYLSISLLCSSVLTFNLSCVTFSLFNIFGSFLFSFSYFATLFFLWFWSLFIFSLFSLYLNYLLHLFSLYLFYLRHLFSLYLFWHFLFPKENRWINYLRNK